MRPIVTSLTIVLFGVLITAHPAVAQIAPGVTQSAAHTANITGTVTQSDGTPVAGADVRLNGPAILSTKSDDRGVFNFRTVPWGTYQIVVTSALGTASRNNIVLNGDITVAIQYQAQPGLRTIAHVSTTAAGASINVTSSSIASINPSDYAFEGNSTWKNLFDQIPGVAVSGYTSGGFAHGGPAGPQMPVILVMNGALPYETSTSLDGMPLYDTSQSLMGGESGGGVDLSNLPLSAFDTADVVRGPGANAPSIVDSIGGSFVLHGPGPVNANHFDFSVSNDPYGGIVTNAKAAFHLGNLSATFIYGVNDSPGPLGTGETMSSFAYTATTINGQPVWGSWFTYGVPNPSGIRNCTDCAITDTVLYCCTPYSTAWSQHSGAIDLSYRFTPSITAELFYAGDTSAQYYLPSRYPTAFSPEAASPPYSGSLAPSPPGQTSYLLINTGAPEPQNQSSSLLEEKVTAYAGSGVVRLAAVQFNSWTGYNYNCNLPNGTYKLWGVANIGATSPGTPTAFNGVNANLTFFPETIVLPSATANRDLLASYDLQIGASSSAGISYVTSYFNAPYFEDVYFGPSLVYSVNAASSIAATTNETRLHFDTQIGDTLSVGLSEYIASASYHVPASEGMYKDLIFPYSAPRLGVVWRPNNDIAVRASVGGGYALPALYNVTGSPLSCGAGYCFETIPNTALKPEEAFALDIGADLRIHRDTVLSVDLYRANLFGQFFTTSSESNLNGQTLIATTFGNIGSSRMEGINLDIRHDVPSGIYWHAMLGLTRGYVVSVPAGFYNGTSGYPPVPCVNCANQTVTPGANFNSAVFPGTVPYASASGQVGYRWNPRTFFDLTGTYYGNNNVFYYPAFVAFDAHAGYRITNTLSLFATFQNITGMHDEPLAIHAPTYAVPSIPGATGYYQGATFGLPYEPRAVIAGLRVSI